VHLDTADRRDLYNVGKVDLRNVWLALRHGARFQYLMLREHPDLVHMPVAESTLGFLRDSLFLIPARLSGQRVVVHIHGGSFGTFYKKARPLLQTLIRFCLKNVGRTVVLDEHFRGNLDGLVPSERIRVVPNGIPTAPYTASQQDRSRSGGKTRILYMGTLVESKGFLDLLEAVPKVIALVPGVEFWLVGDNSLPEARLAEERIRREGLDRQVKFLGIRYGQEKTQILLDASIFVFPTWYPMEGQPLVLLESMAAGLPIVTTRHAAIQQTLGENGALYVKPKSPDEIAEKVITLINDPDLCRQIVQNNRKRLQQSHTLERFAATLKSVWQEALTCPS
jgi:glycosyltransferase involved in cell wall biosynthesis